MDNARQVVRWSIPGLVLVLELGAFAAVLRLADGHDPLGVAAAVDTTAAMLTLLAGVPLGFLLYQLYFRNYRPFGYSLLLMVRYAWVVPAEFSRRILGKQSWQETKKRAVQRFAFVRSDRGAEILNEYLDRRPSATSAGGTTTNGSPATGRSSCPCWTTRPGSRTPG
jgi:hypothetical protein